MGLQTFKASKLKAVKNHVLVKGMRFHERITSGGILMPSDDTKSAGIRPRWAEVVAVGPQQPDVCVGEWVLISHGRWTRGLKLLLAGKEIELRRVDPDDILLISPDEMDDETWSTAFQAQSDLHRIEGSMHNHAGERE